MDLMNKYLVGVRGDEIVIHLPPNLLSKKEALIFAAWIVTLADDSGDEFEKLLTAVHNI